MQDQDLERAKHQRRARLRLPGNDPKCGVCGFDNVLCLEAHHVAGQKYDAETVAICRNCHRIASELQRDHPKVIHAPPTFEERLMHFLKGLADLLEIIVNSLRRFAEQLLAQITTRREKSNEP